MNIFDWILLAVGLPILFVAFDTVAAVRGQRHTPARTGLWSSEDFEVMVPIYGSMRYLETVEYLAEYGDKVLICTTTTETAEFYDELDEVATTHGFRVFRGDVGPRTGASGKRNTGGTIRDRLIRDGLAQVSANNVVCIDADTTTDRPLQELVGAMLAQDYDLVSVQLTPSNVTGWLTRLQAHEYRVAMSLRRIAPWLVSGACHAARTSVHREVMSHHSLFFQGNDVETGILADGLGYRVGHIPFTVPTAVPDTIRGWLRQRLAWAGGEFRLFIVNVHLVTKHPLLWIYGTIIVILAAPLRWITLEGEGWILAAVAGAYLAFSTYINWRTRDRWIPVLPLYAAFISLILTPLGLISYLHMAITSHNAGRITIRHARHGLPEPAPAGRAITS